MNTGCFRGGAGRRGQGLAGDGLVPTLGGVGVDRRQGVFGLGDLLGSGREGAADQDGVDVFWFAPAGTTPIVCPPGPACPPQSSAATWGMPRHAKWPTHGGSSVDARAVRRLARPRLRAHDGDTGTGPGGLARVRVTGARRPTPTHTVSPSTTKSRTTTGARSRISAARLLAPATRRRAAAERSDPAEHHQAHQLPSSSDCCRLMDERESGAGKVPVDQVGVELNMAQKALQPPPPAPSLRR